MGIRPVALIPSLNRQARREGNTQANRQGDRQGQTVM